MFYYLFYLIYYLMYYYLSGLENRVYGRRDPQCCPRDTLYPQMLALTSPTSGDHSVGIVHSRTKVTELLLLIIYFIRLTQKAIFSGMLRTHSGRRLLTFMRNIQLEFSW
jgi:hypothetical protein